MVVGLPSVARIAASRVVCSGARAGAPETQFPTTSELRPIVCHNSAFGTYETEPSKGFT